MPSCYFAMVNDTVEKHMQALLTLPEQRPYCFNTPMYQKFF